MHSPIELRRCSRTDGELRPISDLANKLPEHAARIAGVLALVHDFDAGEVAEDGDGGGDELGAALCRRGVEAEGGTHVSAELRLAQRALDWFCGIGRSRPYRCRIYTNADPRAIRDIKTARKSLRSSSSTASSSR